MQNARLNAAKRKAKCSKTQGWNHQNTHKSAAKRSAKCIKLYIVKWTEILNSMQNSGFGGEKQAQKAVFLVLKTEFWWQENYGFGIK